MFFREDVTSLAKYGKSGFLLVQNLIDNIILQKETDDTNANIQSKINSRTVEDRTKDDLEANMKGQTRLFLDLPVLLAFGRLMNGVVREMEKSVKEAMKLMRLQNSAFYFSWFVT